MALPSETIETAETGVAEDCVAMLYAYGRNGVLVTFFACVFLIAMVYTPGVQHLKFVWLGCMLPVVALRGLDLLVLHPYRRAQGMDPAVEIRLYAAGTIVAGLIWAAFPIVFYPMISLTERAASAIVLCALAGGSATVLSPSLPLAIAYGTLLLVPPSIMMFLIPGRENIFLGVLGLAMYVFLGISSRVANRSLVNALRLSRANERLRASAEIQRLQTQAINAQLETVQTALRDANFSLEDRIAARTADLAHEVAERKRYAEALARLASVDPLTGLCNRSTFAEKLACMLADAERKQRGLAVLFLDLDNFKQVNDVRGHAVGDKVLQRAAGLLSQTAGEGVLIARWGGDEFVMALPIEQNSNCAMALGERVRQSFGEPLKAGLESINLDVTIGIAMFPADGRSQDRLIRAADLAMWEAKREGKGRLKLFDPALASNMAERHALEQALRHAIAKNEFALAFQPIISVQTGACDAFEALLRWNHHELGAIGPGVFIPIAEQSGQIFSIGRWVLRQACRAAASWSGAGMPGAKPPAVTVNVSVAQVLSGTLLEDVKDALSASGLAPSRLQIEITESMFVSDHVRVTPIFEALRAQGIRILLDDFGTGFSSLAYLGKLPIDVIKIDQSFVRAAERDGYAVIGAILSVARALNLQVTAEGVETTAQQQALSSLGVERLQGYLISRPIAEPLVPAWLETTYYSASATDTVLAA